MITKQLTVISATGAWRWRMVREVFVNQAVRPRDDQRSTGTGRDIAKQRVRPDTSRRRQGTDIVRVDMPPARRHIPRIVRRKREKQRTPVSRLVEGLALERSVDRLEHSRAADRAECRIVFD